MTAAPSSPAESVTTGQHPIALFFDGECCFCNRWVGRLMKADTARRTRFGAKQGRTFQQVARNHPEVAKVDSIVAVVRQPDGTEQALVRRDAVMAAIDGLPGYAFFATVLKVIPRPLSDFGYGVVSKLRTLVFGRQDLCHLVRPQERALFLD